MMKKFLLLLTGVMLCFFFSCTKDEKLSSEKQILEFSISSFGSNGNGKIDEVAKAITFEVPSGTDVTKLAPLIKVSPSATVVPAIGVEQDFTNPVSYTVTAEDGSVQVYVIKVVVLKSVEKQLLSFKLAGLTPEVTGKVDEVKKTVSLQVPFGTDVTGLVPTITFSKGAAVTPASGAKQDFTKAVTYTVTAEDGSKQEYVVAVEVGKNSEKKISEFKLAGITPQVAGVVNEEKKTISLSVPFGTDVTGLVPTITSSKGAVVTPASGAKQDFTKAVTYTVTAEDGSKQEYVVAVEVGKSSDKKISEFKLAGITPQVAGVVNEEKKTISLSVPFGTDVTGLVPTITSSKGAIVTPASGAKQDFTKAVTYTVTAEDGSKQEYTVTIVVCEAAKSSLKRMTAFRFAGLTPPVDGVVDETRKTISVTVHFGTNVRSLMPSITISEKAKVSPASAESMDFIIPVDYTVTAEDGSAQVYRVEVKVAPEVILGKESKIVAFKFAGLTPAVVATVDEGSRSIYALVPFGTDITKLVPTITISGDASISPKSNVETDFSRGITYTVTAMDGKTKTKYDVSVEVAKEANPNAPVITSVKNADNLMPGIGKIVVLGKNLRKEGKISRIKIGNTTLVGTVNEEGTEITASMSPAIAVGATKVSVRVDVDNSNELDITIKENPFPAPVIESVDKTALVDGDEIVITGSNFMAEGNGVLLTLKSFPNTPVSLVLVSETPTMLKFKFDKSKSAKLKSGPYKLSVYSNGKKVNYGVDINVTL